MLVIFYTVYNDMPFIIESLNSVKNFADKIIAIDGRYKDFPGIDNFSDDGTFEFLQKECATCYGIANLTEIQKRNLLFGHVSVGDTVLVIDADETLVGEIPELSEDIGVVHLTEAAYGTCMGFNLCNRFFKVQAGLNYHGAHHRILKSNKDLFAESEKIGEVSSRLITEFHLVHNRYHRSVKRQSDKEKYYEILRNGENGKLQ